MTGRQMWTMWVAVAAVAFALGVVVGWFGAGEFSIDVRAVERCLAQDGAYMHADGECVR